MSMRSPPAAKCLLGVADREDPALHLLFERGDDLAPGRAPGRAARGRARRPWRRRSPRRRTPYCASEYVAVARGCAAISAVRRAGAGGRRRSTTGRKRLNPGLPSAGIQGEEEVAAPEAPARDGAVGLAVDGEEDAARALGLRRAPGDDEHVAIRVGVDGAGAQAREREGHGVVVAAVLARGRAPGPGVDGVGELDAEEVDEGVRPRGALRGGIEVGVPAQAVRRERRRRRACSSRSRRAGPSL